jgi:hypothetical protein
MACKIDLRLTLYLLLNFITNVIRDRDTFGIQVEEEYNRQSELVDTSSTDFLDKGVKFDARRK